MNSTLCSRRDWLTLAVGCAALPLAARPSETAMLSGFYYRDYSRCLPDYVTALARAAYEKRREALARLTTPKAIEERQAWTRETLWKLIGGMPERTPLKERVVGRFERANYIVEKLTYESRPGVIVSANLYLPKTGKPPYPGVLFQMGHADEGKAYPSYQKCCQGLAQLGYVVLAFDPMGQGERIAYPDSSGVRTRLPSVDDEHTVPGKQMLLIGDSAARYQLWDAMRSLDYLAAHHLVDPHRLASAGQSGGATLTMLQACVDERLSTAVICSGNTENIATGHFNSPGATDDAEQDLVGAGPLGFDRWDLLYPIAPKPLLIQVSAHDFYGTYSPQHLEDGRQEFGELERVYGTLGYAERLEWRSTPLPHGLTYAFRLDVYNWFERWLKGSSRQIGEEPAVHPEAERQLWVGATGNVTRDYSSLRPFDLIKRGAKAIAAEHVSNADWMRSLQVEVPNSNLQFQRLATTPLAGVQVIAAEVNSSPGIWIPVWLFVPNKPQNGSPTLLALDDRGRNQGAAEDGLYHSIARAGTLVCAADLRGIGDTRPEVGRGNPGYTVPHASEEDYAWVSLILGRPLLGQRIVDILSLTTALGNCEEAAHRPVSVAARGRLSIPALFAFSAAPTLASLYLCEGLVSYENLLQTESYNQSLANFSWNLFGETDLPRLAAQSSPRRIHIAGATDAAGRVLPQAIVRQTYAGTNITVSSAPAWDAKALGTVSV